MVRILGKNPSILNQFIGEIRDAEIQKDGMRFRRNLERIGEIFAMEISRELHFEEKEVVTPLGIANVPVLSEYPVLATILRAGLPFHQGLLNVFDKSENAFISAYRKHHKDGSFTIAVDSLSTADVSGKVLVLSDVMLATGASMVYAYKEMINRGKPSHTHIIAILASVEGLDYMKKHLPQTGVTVWVGVVDDELTAQAYIVPGLGDAGDLAFGKKI
jgi:uracil phosphoribosyltransferase